MGSNTQWRMVPSFEHGDLCRAFGLDPVRFRFDLPRSAYASDRSRERVSGYVMHGDAPVGTLHVAREGERFRDLDPATERLDLRQTDHN